MIAGLLRAVTLPQTGIIIVAIKLNLARPLNHWAVIRRAASSSEGSRSLGAITIDSVNAALDTLEKKESVFGMLEFWQSHVGMKGEKA